MKKYIYIVFALFVFVGTSCQKDELPLFSSGRLIYFPVTEMGDSLSYSFLYNQGRDRYEMLIPVKYTGPSLEENVTFALEIVSGETTAEAGEYNIELEQPFRAGSFQDTLRVVLIDRDRLKERSVDLAFRLVTNEHFKASMLDSLDMKITYTHQVGKPEWWTQDVVNSYLGQYSDTKYSEFVNHIYAGDFGKLDSNEKLHYARKFKYHLAEREEPLYDEFGLVTVPVVS